MESEHYRLQLEDTKKKLAALAKQIERLVDSNSKLGIGMDYVISTVNELQSLLEWTAHKKELKVDSAVIFQKLQQLERIRKDLERTAAESEQCLIQDEDQQEPFNLEGNKIIQAPEDSITDAKDEVLKQLVNESKVKQQVMFIENNLKNLELNKSSSNGNNQIPESAMPGDEVDKAMQDIAIDELNIAKKDVDTPSMMGPNFSDDEGLGDESRRSDFTGPSSFNEVQDAMSNSTLEENLAQEKESILIEADTYDENMDWLRNLKDPKNSLEICLRAIGNLRESLKEKENELLKLSEIQNDQKQITDLQDVIMNYHEENTKLKELMETREKEVTTLREQVLELEEAENDSRNEAQRLGERLLFLQQKDAHFQEELAELKQSLATCADELAAKDVEEQELHSQLKYVETLVQKYEEQIHTLEVVELALRKKIIEQEDEIKALETKHHNKCDKGTQSYPPRSKKSFPSANEDFATVDAINAPSSSLEMQTQREDDGNFGTTASNDSEVPLKAARIDACVQTDSDLVKGQLRLNFEAESPTSKPPRRTVIEIPSLDTDTSTIESKTQCPIQRELLKRLHQLVEEDANLQQQLHYVDQINLTLWKKLHNLEFHIGECKKQNMSDECTSDCCIDSESGAASSTCSRPCSREQTGYETPRDAQCDSPCPSKGIMACLDQGEQEIKERLQKLEQINASFEKELEMREQLYLEKERKYGEWIQTEQRFISDLKRLEDERDSLTNQVAEMEYEKQELTNKVCKLQEELNSANEKHRQETLTIKAEQAEITQMLQQRVDNLMIQEKDHLKQITNMKLEKTNSDKAESDKLKASYVECQILLSRTREEMRQKEEEFRARLDEARRKHTMEEARLQSELEMLRNKNESYDDMINNFQLRHHELINILRQKEHDLEEARLEYKKNMETTEEEHRAVEAELKNQLRQMEEGTAIATKVLTEERVRLEKELQENIYDLRCKEEVYKARIAELESNVSQLHDELHRITGDLDSGFESEVSQDGGCSYRRERLIHELRDLRDRELELREKLDDMEQKEVAYRETLEHADRIVASVEQGYKNKIEELEISERNLKQRVGHLEEIESRLRGALHKERRSSDGRKPDELVMELVEAESRENGLKEKVSTLEQLQRSAMSKVKDLEKIRERLETQLNDKDELSSNLERTQQELDLARKCIAKLKKSESDLHASLQQSESTLSSTEAEMKAKLYALEEEKGGLNETIEELRSQVRDLKKLDRSPEEEEESIHAATSKPLTTINKTPKNNLDEFDYVEIEDIAAKPAAKASSSPYRSVPDSKSVTDIPGKKSAAPSPLVPVPPTWKSTEVFPTSQRDEKVQQPRSQSAMDTYDTARQNLEDCMMRAITAMKMDLENKQLNKEQKGQSGKRTPDAAKSNRSSQQEASDQSTEDHDYDEVLPRPTNFRVVQQVGSDTLLIGWEYVNPSILEGFEVYVDGHLHETVYTPDRTKALISGLNLDRPLRLSISALSRCGQMSEPQYLELAAPQDRSNGFLFQDEDDEDDDSVFGDAVFEKQRPYSMEW